MGITDMKPNVYILITNTQKLKKMNKMLAELNFNKLLYYENIRGYSKQKPFKCNGFCIDCELKGILKDGEKLERMSHGADSDDFRKVIPKQYNNNTPIMFLMLFESKNVRKIIFFSIADKILEQSSFLAY